MNTKSFLILSAKILTACAAGVAIFMGLGKAVDKSYKNPLSGERKKDSMKEEEPERGVASSKSEKLVTGFRKIQDTCGRIFGVAQSLSTMVENLFRIFSRPYDPGFNQNMNQSYGCGPQGFTRLTPYIIEAGFNPTGTYYGQNNGKYRF